MPWNMQDVVMTGAALMYVATLLWRTFRLGKTGLQLQVQGVFFNPEQRVTPSESYKFSSTGVLKQSVD
jgi:hypothetical protein